MSAAVTESGRRPLQAAVTGSGLPLVVTVTGGRHRKRAAAEMAAVTQTMP
jgi:hypothetical protein